MEDESLPAAFDMSFSTNNRINFLLWQCNEASTSDDVMGWFKACKNILKEVVIGMKEKDGKNEELEQHQEHIKQIETALNKYLQYQRSYTTTGAKAPFNPPRDVFDLLYNWEMKLRRKLDKMNLLLRRGDNAYSAME